MPCPSVLNTQASSKLSRGVPRNVNPRLGQDARVPSACNTDPTMDGCSIHCIAMLTLPDHTPVLHPAKPSLRCAAGETVGRVYVRQARGLHCSPKCICARSTYPARVATRWGRVGTGAVGRSFPFSLLLLELGLECESYDRVTDPIGLCAAAAAALDGHYVRSRRVR